MTYDAFHPKYLHNNDMFMITRLLIISLTLATVGCIETRLPVFGDPTPLSVPSGKPAYGPRLTQSNYDGAILSWMEKQEGKSSLHFSGFAIDAWETSKTAVTDEKMFVNWADLPAVLATGSDSLLAFWLSYTADAPYAYQVLTATSVDEGVTWSQPLSPHTDGTPTEHGFVSTFNAASGTGLIWLDGRNTPDNGMTLRSAVLDDSGNLSDEALLDNMICDCCKTDVALADAGPVAVYRDRTDKEIRDIYVSRQVDGEWQEGVAVSDDGWEISGCPVNGPSIAAAGKRVVVTWFTAANDVPIVKAAVSRNGGKSFSEPVEIASKNAQGHVAISMIDRDTFAISWVEKNQEGSYSINLRGLSFDGRLGRVETIGKTSVGRTFPQMVRIRDELVFAWTDEMNDLSKVASVKVPIIGFYD